MWRPTPVVATLGHRRDWTGVHSRRVTRRLRASTYLKAYKESVLAGMSTLSYKISVYAYNTQHPRNDRFPKRKES